MIQAFKPFFPDQIQIPRRGLTENFNMAKINNLAIPGGGWVGRWGGGCSGPAVLPSGSAHVDVFAYLLFLTATSL